MNYTRNNNGKFSAVPKDDWRDRISVTEFCGFEYVYTRDVLKPYPDAEEIVDKAVRIIGDKAASVCDLGLGSGCLAISVLRQCPNAHAIGLDITEASIDVATENARLLGVENRFEARLSDVFSSVENEIFDVIICNLPYWTPGEADAAVDIMRYGPRSAFTDEIDGLSFFPQVTTHQYLRPGGHLILECGRTQLEAVLKLFDAAWTRIDITLRTGSNPVITAT